MTGLERHDHYSSNDMDPTEGQDHFLVEFISYSTEEPIPGMLIRESLGRDLNVTKTHFMKL